MSFTSDRSRTRLAAEIADTLDALRREADGSYACLLDGERIVFEQPEPESPAERKLHRLFEEKAAAIFAIPEGMETGGPLEDVFEGWEEEFFLAFINGRIVLVVACPEAEPMRERAFPLLKVLADRLLRWDDRYRMDRQGRGFFFGRPRLDVVVVGRHGA